VRANIIHEGLQTALYDDDKPQLRDITATIGLTGIGKSFTQTRYYRDVNSDKQCMN